MPVKYQDPYKEDPYGKLKGDKADSYFKVTFDEAKIYKTDDAYIIAAYVTAYEGIVRAYKADQMLMPGLCAIPIYGQEYSIRKKDNKGEWTDEKHQPSLFEKALYESIKADEVTLIGDGYVLGGHICHLPSAMLESSTPDQVNNMVAANISFTPKESTGKLLEYKPPTSRSYSKGGGKSWGLSPDQRLEFLKKQLRSDLDLVKLDESSTLSTLTLEMHKELEGNLELTTIYFDMLIACIK